MAPEGMAYSSIVGVPPIMGLYTLVPPLIVCALLGTSCVLVVSPDTATGLITAAAVGANAAQGTATLNKPMRLGCMEGIVGSANFHERVTDGERARRQS